jgi:dTDP-glucose 4,6-dehydratase
MSTLITGAAGFIGSAFVRQFAESEQGTLQLLDSITYAGDLRNIPNGAENKNFFQIDIRDKSSLRKLFKSQGIDQIVHFAAESHVDRSIVNPGLFAETNIIGTVNLLECAREFSIKKFLHVSTDEVYGSLTEGFATESYPLNPSSPYSASKAAAEHFVFSYMHTFNLPINVVRCSNNYGPRQYPEKVIPFFISKLMNNKPVPVYGTGRNVREWMHVSDCARAIAAVLANGKNGAVYNISSGVFRENIQVAELLIQLMGKDKALIEFVEDRKGHDFRYAIDSSKIRTELDWEPQITLEVGMAETITWYQRHKDRIEYLND